jgi:hypothetical protein
MASGVDVRGGTGEGDGVGTGFRESMTRRRLPGRWPVVAVAGVGAVVIGIAGLLVLPRLGAPPGSDPVGVPRFVEETGSAGLEHAYGGDFNFFVGGGVAAFDCDDDGRSELFVAGGANEAGLFHNDSINGGALRFSRVPSPVTDLLSVTGAYPLDVDGDGRTDLSVLRLGENVMLRGLGACRFERANEAWGLDGDDAWTAAFSATWEDESSRPTLAFGNYLELAPDGEPGGECGVSTLVRPGADGAYGRPLPLLPGYCPLSALFSDWSRSGRRDLRLSNDRHYANEAREQLWRTVPGEPPRLYTDADGWQLLRIWGMGIASQDVTGDGLSEVYLTSQGDNRLLTLVDGPSQPRYGNIALQVGASANRPFSGDTALPSTAWHAEFQDVNNDTLMDLFVAKGNVEAMPDYAARDPSNLLLGQPDGSFVEAAGEAGILSFARARGAALVDLNLDGLLDLVAVNRRENVKIWRNLGRGTDDVPGPMGNWVAVRLRQPGANRDAIGAWLEVRAGGRTIHREVLVGGGHAGGQLGWIHFGLGAATGADVRVHWPDGHQGPWIPLAANERAIVDRDAAEPQRWLPAG